jgi:hypothetical protein
MAERHSLNFDGDGLRLVQDAFTYGWAHQMARHRQYEEDWLLYNAYVEMKGRNPEMPNISLPEMYAIIETQTPEIAQALFGRRPVFPFESRRKEYRQISRFITTYIDELLARAGLYPEGEMLAKLAGLYGTAYMSVYPKYELVTAKKIVDDPRTGRKVMAEEKTYRLRLGIETWAPWDVIVDPRATGLEHAEQCRYVVKVRSTTKRQIKQMAERGSFPGLDLDKLNASGVGSRTYKENSTGNNMLTRYGLPEPKSEDDDCVLLSYESPERTIDVLNGDVIIRETDEDLYGHGCINLDRLIQTSVPHTGNRFYGIGHAKPNEVLIAMLNDSYNLTFAVHGMNAQPVIFFRSSFVDPQNLIWSQCNRIPVGSAPGNPISDDYDVRTGEQLPKEHYMLPDMLRRQIDKTSGVSAPMRGEIMGGEQLATEINNSVVRGDKRLQGTLLLQEETFSRSFSHKLACIVDKYSNFNDMLEILSMRDALQMYTVNPEQLPGGHNLMVRGAARVGQLHGQKQALAEMAPLLMQSPARRVGGVERTWARLQDFDENEIDDMLMTREEIELSQQMQLAAVQAQGQIEARQAQEERADKQKATKA